MQKPEIQTGHNSECYFDFSEICGYVGLLLSCDLADVSKTRQHFEDWEQELLRQMPEYAHKSFRNKWELYRKHPLGKKAIPQLQNFWSWFYTVYQSELGKEHPVLFKAAELLAEESTPDWVRPILLCFQQEFGDQFPIYW